MQIKIEIDVKPEELRKFLGLPDVAGLQEDVIQFLRTSLSSAGDNFDPTSFVKDNLDNILKHPKVQRLLFGAAADAQRQRRGGGSDDTSSPE